MIELITVEFHSGTIFTLAAEEVGRDGADRSVFVGDIDMGKHLQHKCAAVIFMGSDKFLVALHIGDGASAAAAKAIAEKRSGYGGGHKDPLDNWTTYTKHKHKVTVA